MQLTENQYNELVEKLADEIIEDTFEKEAGIKDVLSGKNIRKSSKKVKDLNSRINSGNLAAMPGKATVSQAKKKLRREVGKTVGAYAGGASAVGGTTAAGVAAKRAIDKKKSSKNNAELEEKAAELYDYAMRKIAACEAMYNDGLSDQEACIEVLAEAGMYDEDGFNKEAAEESQEAYDFATEVSSIYDESLNKIAAAEECYQEAVQDLGRATEVLEAFGYEFE